MDHVSFRQSLVRWWQDHWVLLVAKLAMPVALIALIGVMMLWGDEGNTGPGPGPGSCPPRPTAALPFDPADEQKLSDYATDIFVGQVVGYWSGPGPASPVPGAPPDVLPRHLTVAILETQKGTAAGIVVVHHAFAHGIAGCNGGVAGESDIEQGDVSRFMTVRDDPTGTYSLIAGRYSHERVELLPGTIVPLRSPTVTRAPTTTPSPPPGQLQIHKRDGDGNPIDETCFKITGPSNFERNVCDADEGVNDGETSALDLQPGSYTVTEISTKPGYVRSPTSQTVFVVSGAVAELTFVNEPEPKIEGVPVYIYALKCGRNPGAVDVDDIAAGILPNGCVLASGVEFVVFDIDEQTNGFVDQLVTDGSGRLSFHALDGHLLWIEESNDSAWPSVPVLRETTVTVQPNLRVAFVHIGGCTVSPDEAQIGEIVSVECPGFDAFETVIFMWDFTGQSETVTVKANSAGLATASFRMSQATNGSHLVAAIGEQSGKDFGGIARVRSKPIETGSAQKTPES